MNALIDYLTALLEYINLLSICAAGFYAYIDLSIWLAGFYALPGPPFIRPLFQYYINFFEKLELIAFVDELIKSSLRNYICNVRSLFIQLI